MPLPHPSPHLRSVRRSQLSQRTASFPSGISLARRCVRNGFSYLIDQFNVSVQQQLATGVTFELAYVGNIGKHMYPGETFGYDLNQLTLPTTPAQLAAGNTSRRPYLNRLVGTYNGVANLCCLNGIGSSRPDSRATYNALQTKLDKRFSNGLQFNETTLGPRRKSSPTIRLISITGSSIAGRNDTNRTHLFVLSSVYALPFGRGKMFLGDSNCLMDALIGGYTLAEQSNMGEWPALHSDLPGVRRGSGSRHQLRRTGNDQRLSSK